MADTDSILGIVLAGGRSSRMGDNKALLDFRGRALIDQMLDLLTEAGCRETLISGEVPGYPGAPDPEPFRGPARALSALLTDIDHYSGALVVPVDMPFLPVPALRTLMLSPASCCYHQRPLPAFFRLPCQSGNTDSMAGLLDTNQARRLLLPACWEAGMINLNTPQQWRQSVNHESAAES